jgi:hypothetical protein
MRPFLLPVFFYAGQVNAAAETPGLSDSQTVALTELRALLLWSLQQLRILTDAQVPFVMPQRYAPCSLRLYKADHVMWSRSLQPCTCALVLVTPNTHHSGMVQAKVFLALMPVHEPETAPHRNARLAGLKDIVTILHRCANLQSLHPAFLMLACQCAVACAA